MDTFQEKLRKTSEKYHSFSRFTIVFLFYPGFRPVLTFPSSDPYFPSLHTIPDPPYSKTSNFRTNFKSTNILLYFLIMIAPIHILTLFPSTAWRDPCPFSFSGPPLTRDGQESNDPGRDRSWKDTGQWRRICKHFPSCIFTFSGFPHVSHFSHFRVFRIYCIFRIFASFCIFVSPLMR